MSTMRPLRRVSIAGSAARVSWMGACRLTSSRASIEDGSIVSKAVVSSSPALFTSTSIGPAASMCGVGVALQLVPAAGSGGVTLVSMAPNGETAGLRTALAMGAAKATLGSDDTLKGSDALATAKVLAAAIKRNEYDLILAATEST